MRVLTVVDEATARQQLEDFFHRRHHELTVCGGVDEARAALAETSYAFVLIDLEQDPTGALELCHELKSRQAFVLVVSKEQSPESIRAALEAGADDCLIKPLTPTALQLRLAVGHRSLSARKRSVRTAQDSQQRLRTLLETMREGVFQVDRQGKIELANSRLSRMTGYTLDELVGRSADEILVAPSVREKLPGQTLLGSGTGSEQYTIPLATQSGEPIWVKLTAAPMSTGGAAAGSLGVVQDITEQRQAEESLRFREEYFRVLLENASLTHVERHETSTAQHHAHRLDERSERIVERIVDLRPTLAAEAGAGHQVTQRLVDSGGSQAAPHIEIHIGRLEIGETRRPISLDTAGPEPHRKRTTAPAPGLSAYPAARNKRSATGPPLLRAPL